MGTPMRRLTINNYLFLIPMLFLGPLILFALILHGLILDRYYRAKRWLDRAFRANHSDQHLLGPPAEPPLPS